MVYECYDEYRFDTARDQYLQDQADLEQQLLKHASLVFTTSKSLYEDRRSKHPRVFYTPNGVDFDVFSRSQDPLTPIPEDLADIPEPRVGFIGSITGALDFGLLRKIALSDLGRSLVLVGPVSDEVLEQAENLSGLPNAYVLGRRPRSSLPEYLKGMDVGLIPFHKNRHNFDRNPLKLWEYMASGTPVVTTPIAELEDLENVVFTAADHADFLMQVETVLNTDVTERVLRGVELASRHSWSVLTMRMYSMLEQTLRETGNRHEDLA